MELQELYKKTLELFECDSAENLGTSLLKACDDPEKLTAFSDLVDGDLSKDWLQMIYQYYLADREEKKQDYTPACLARFLSLLIGDSVETVDMCAGSGALTIQRWRDHPDMSFELYEIDETVIPFLVFNMVIRNITATVIHADVLQNETYEKYLIEKGEQFGKVAYIESAV